MTRISPVRHQPELDADWSYDLGQSQDRQREAWEEFYERNPRADGVFIEDEALTAYTANDIDHKLGRTLRGWEVVRDTASLADFHAYLSANQTGVVTATFTDVVYDTERHDNGGNYDASTGIFTAPHTGLYGFSATVLFAGLADTVRYAATFLHGSTSIWGTDTVMGGAAPACGLVSTSALRMTKADTIKVQCYQVSGGNENLLGGALDYTHFEGRAIDELSDGQGELDSDNQKVSLRLYSSRARTVSLWVW